MRQKQRKWIPRAHGAEVALRTALSLGIALCALAFLGRLDLASYAMFGSFCAVFGFNEPYRVRARTVGLAGLGILVSISTGILLSAAHAPVAAIGVATLVLLALAVPANVVIGVIPAPRSSTSSRCSSARRSPPRDPRSRSGSRSQRARRRSPG